MKNGDKSWPSVSEYADMQDGMLAYFNHQAKQSDWYAERILRQAQEDDVPFDFQDFVQDTQELRRK